MRKYHGAMDPVAHVPLWINRGIGSRSKVPHQWTFVPPDHAPMKHLALFGGMCLLQTAGAQCLQSDLGFDPATQPLLIKDVELVNNELFVVLEPYYPWFTVGSKPMVVNKSDDTGQPVWRKRVVPTNPGFMLNICGVLRTQDGGVFAYGDLRHKSDIQPRFKYINHFAIKLDATGEVEWARIYMLPDTDVTVPYWADPGYYRHRSAMEYGAIELQGGGYCWLINSTARTNVVRLDASGLPVSAKAYRDPGFASQPSLTVLNSEGGVFRISHLDSSGFHTTAIAMIAATGGVEWSNRPSEDLYFNVNSTPPGALVADNGDLVVVGESYATGVDALLYRISPDGTIVWCRSVLGYGLNSLAETADGDLLMGNGNLYRVPGDGQGAADYWTSSPSTAHIDISSNSIALGRGEWWEYVTNVGLFPDVNDLSSGCGLVPQADEPLTPVNITTTPSILEADTTTVKTWTMSIADNSGMDLDLVVGGSTGFLRPGFDTWIYGAVLNRSGTACGATTVTCTLPVVLTPESYDPPPTNITGNVITWVVDGGLPSDGYWDFSISANLPADAGLIGTIVQVPLTVTQGDPEVDLMNNAYTITKIIGGSYDPNNKLVRTSTAASADIYYPETDEWLDYTINFQNTGTDTAFTVVLTDSLPATIRVGSYMPLGASHPYTYELGGNGVLRFTFADILLPDSNTNEAASHGSVSFRIRPEADLAPGTLIANRADIFFDFNEPVRTADANVWIDNPNVLRENTAEILHLYPDPVNEKATVVLPSTGFRSFRILALDGRCARSGPVAPGSRAIVMDIHELEPQVYVLSLEGLNGVRVTTRFVKR